MKWILVVTLVMVAALQSEAKTKKHSTPKKAKATAKADTRKLEKNIFFSDRIVKGKHQVPGEGLVTVENEKPVFNLLSIRSEFNDRREKERQRD